jgi:1-acyl-sn-glycerol-3-phosphate acyltransferase
MKENQPKKAKLFNPKLFPMDLARVIFSPLPLVFRVRRLTPDGKKYKGKIRGGAIVAANHNAFSDSMVLFVAFWYRRLFFMVADVVMKTKLRAALIRGIGGIEIVREIADLQAIKKAVGVLKEGHLLAIFPQGRIMKQGEVDNVKHGTVLMALQAGVPIYPTYIYPRKHFFSRYTVVIGDPIYPNELCKRKIPSTADIERISEVLRQEMNRCNLSLKNTEEKV